MAQSLLTRGMYLFYMPFIPDVLAPGLLGALAFESVDPGVVLAGPFR